MIVYHGTTEVIEMPGVKHSKKNTLILEKVFI